MTSHDKEPGPTENVSLTLMQSTKSAEMFNKAVEKLSTGDIRAAILLLQQSEFFAPDDPTPVVAHAECYVFLCDLQSAVRFYRRALWLVQKRDNVNPTEQKPATIISTTQSLSSAIPFNTAGLSFNTRSAGSAGTSLPQDSYDSSTQIHETTWTKASFDAGSPLQTPQLDARNMDELARQETQVGLSPNSRVAAPMWGLSEAAQQDDAFRDSTNTDPTAGSYTMCTSHTHRMMRVNYSVQLSDIQSRLAGLLDALGLALFHLTDFSHALQCAEDSLSFVDDPIVQLHRCVYLMSLQREEEAESLLEQHRQKHARCKMQTSAMLIQLYVNRQAFRPARMLLDEYSSASRYEDCLTVARHIFHFKYDRYRQKALEKKDLGTIGKCIDVFPNDVELLFARAKIHIDAGDHKKSVKDLFRCVKETNGSHKEAIETMTSVLFTIGTGLDGKEGIQDAIVYYSESLKWRSDNTLVLLARADCYVKLEDYENALLDYRRILQINPDDPVASRRIAFLHDLWGRKMYSMDKVRDAEIEFSLAIKECETEPLFYYHRALCRFNLNEVRYGLRDVLSCQQLKPSDPSIQAFIVRYLGNSEAPDTTKAFKDAEMNRLVSKGEGDEKPQLTNAAVPASSFTAQKVANKLYGKPSARISKVLTEAHDASEAAGRGVVPIEKVTDYVQGATSRSHIGFVDFVCKNAPDGALTVVTGSRTAMFERKAPCPRGRQSPGTRLPSILKRTTSFSNKDATLSPKSQAKRDAHVRIQEPSFSSPVSGPAAEALKKFDSSAAQSAIPPT